MSRWPLTKCFSGTLRGVLRPGRASLFGRHDSFLAEQSHGQHSCRYFGQKVWGPWWLQLKRTELRRREGGRSGIGVGRRDASRELGPGASRLQTPALCQVLHLLKYQ